MTVGNVYNTGIDYSQYYTGTAQKADNSYYYDNTAVTYPDDSYTSSSEGCTDGKDDGKIGFFSAIGNALKGVGNTVVGAVKGMFTNKEGKFSLGKTLLTIGTAALCIAVPAVGVAMCAVGAVAGAAQVGKGFYNAATATTDEQAKNAWQDIGGGGFQVAASVVGAKAGIKAVKSSSTAGLAGLDDATAAVAKLNGKTSALSQLDDAATMTQKASALGKDMLSSTKNNVKNIKNNLAPTLKTGKEVKEINNMRKANADALNKQAKGEILSEAEQQAITDWQNISNKGFSAESLKIARNQNTQSYLVNEFKTAVKSGDKALIKKAGDDIVTYAKDNTVFGKIPEGTSAKIIDVAKHPYQTAKTVLTKDNATRLFNTIKDNAKNTSTSLKTLNSKLTGNAKSILKDIVNSNSSYSQIVNKYGYDNVAQVLKVVAGEEVGTYEA